MTRKLVGIMLMALALLFTGFTLAEEEGKQPEMSPEQQAEMAAYMMAGTPGAPHKALAATTGTFDLSTKSWHDPSGPAIESKGTAVRTMGLDGRVLTEKMESTMMGMSYIGHLMIGHDNVTGKYWSVWTDSMSTGAMVSEGTCDDKQTCTFNGSWNDPITKGPFKVRMETRWPSATSQIFEMYGPGKDGKEMKMMEMTYSKK